MIRNRLHALIGMALLSTATPGAAATPPEATGLMAGAGKADITPPAAEITGRGRVRDPLFARAIVVRAAKTCAALVGLDQGGTTDAVMQRALPEVRKITGCPEANILISATHTHSGGTRGPDGDPARVAQGIVTAVREANGKLQPARIGYGTVNVDLNANRDLYTGKQEWVQANNPDGPSDKTLAVTIFAGADGQPIGLYLNYAMHPVDFYLSGVISGDFAGETSRYLEKRYADNAVAIFAQGASGDQNPRLLGLPNNLMMAALGAPAMSDTVATQPFWEAGTGPRPAGPPPPQDPTRYENAYAQVSAGVDAMAWTIGESALQVIRRPDLDLDTDAPIWGGQKSIQCPGRNIKSGAIMPGSVNKVPEYGDGAPVDMKVGVLRIGNVYFVSVNGEVYSEIATRLKRVSPAGQVMMVTLANGLANSGYIYSNSASERRSFQVLSSRLKPGCAEDSIVETAVDLLSAATR